MNLGPFELDTIVVGPCRDVLSQIPSGCVDLILTDPPYPQKFQDCYIDLAEEGSRVLKVGGSLVTLCGHYQVPFVIEQLSKHLRYWWIGGMIHHTLKRFPGKWVNVRGKPALWYVKERRRKGDTECPIDFLADKGKSKALHPWQQGTYWFAHWIERLCPESGVVVDPFMGSGTTAAAAAQQGRHYFGCDIDPGCANLWQQRLGAMQLSFL